MQTSLLEAKKLMEAALFMSPKALTLTELYDICQTPLTDLRTALNELIEEYRERESALEIIENSAGYQMKVRNVYEEPVRKLAGGVHLGKSEMKTLAYIALKQPVKQSILVKYRTNKAYDDIKILEQEGFILREPAEKTFLIRTTKKFLKYFGSDSVALKPNPKVMPASSVKEES